jgi:hypothetical protein
MKKYKNLLFVLFFLLITQQISFAQNAVTVGVDNPSAASFAIVNVFAKAVVIQGSIVHLVWENYDPSNIKEVVLESTDDGINFTQTAQTLISSLIDIHLYNYPVQMDYNNHILMSSEHGGIRFMYNDVVQNIDFDHHPVWYRIKMKTFAGFTYTSQQFSSNGQEQNENSNFLNTNETSESTSVTNKQSVTKSPCPSIATPPSGYLPCGITRTIQGLCCTYTETRYYNPDTSLISPIAGCPNGNDWCCNNVPEAATCAAGSAVDYCCVHHCADYALCSCVPWTCCTNTIDSVWVVTSSTVNAPFPVMATATPTAICSGEYTILSATSSPVQPGMTFLWLPGYSTGQTVTAYPISTVVYTVIATDSTGNCTGTASVAVTVNPPVTPNFSIWESICVGANFTLPSVSNNGITGTWAPPVDNTATTTYIFTPDPGQCANAGAATVTVNPIPPTPTIVLNGSILYSSALTGNHWYFNGTLIPTATGYFYDASLTGNGNYYVIVTNNNCTSDTSNYVFINVGIEGYDMSKFISIYPNPAYDHLIILYPKMGVIAQIYDTKGALVCNENVVRNSVDIHSLAAGMYFIKLITEEGSVVKKFVKE